MAAKNSLQTSAMMLEFPHALACWNAQSAIDDDLDEVAGGAVLSLGMLCVGKPQPRHGPSVMAS